MNKILVANRGEIACRVIDSCRRLGIATVAVYSEADAGALHVSLADEAVAIGPAPARESYLVVDRLVEAAVASGAQGIHPGYGFLSENAAFARAVEAAGLTWIGPDPGSIEDMGDKERARDIANASGVPILAGSARFSAEALDGIEEAAAAVGYPLLVKACAGGGGIGMRRVDGESVLRKVAQATGSMAGRAFGDPAIYLERFIERARHVEIQVFGFGDGRAVHLGERDCSVQRRFQKMIEESPAPGLPAAVREDMARAAVALCRHERYRGAGTVELVVDAQRLDFHFLEMNCRIQVEHPVTEMTTGTDLVAWQIELARGNLGSIEQSCIVMSGHAIECRLYAENPVRHFLPSPGSLTRFRLPEPSPHVRVDTGFREGDEVTFHYDPMLAKIVVHGDDRDAAIDRMREALDTVDVGGIATNATYLAACLDHPEFRAGEVTTDFIDRNHEALLAQSRAMRCSARSPDHARSRAAALPSGR